MTYNVLSGTLSLYTTTMDSINSNCIVQKVFTHNYQWRFQFIEFYINDCFSFG